MGTSPEKKNGISASCEALPALFGKPHKKPRYFLFFSRWKGPAGIHPAHFYEAARAESAFCHKSFLSIRIRNQTDKTAGRRSEVQMPAMDRRGGADGAGSRAAGERSQYLQKMAVFVILTLSSFRSFPMALLKAALESPKSRAILSGSASLSV